MPRIITLFAILTITRIIPARADPLSPDSFQRIGDVELGKTNPMVPGLSAVEARADGARTWARTVSDNALPSGVKATRLEYATYGSRLLSVTLFASGDDGRALGAWIAAQLGPGTPQGKVFTWKGERVAVTYEPASSTTSGDYLAPTRVCFESLEVLAQIAQDAKAAEAALSLQWKGTFSGVDARLDPRVATALDSAAAKYGWAGALKVTGTLSLVGAAVVAFASKGESGSTLLVPVGYGAIALGLGTFLGFSAAEDIASVTAPR